MPTHLFEVTVIGKFLGEDIVNRFTYRGDGDTVPSGNSFGLLSAMGFVPVAGAFPDNTLAKELQGAVNASMVWSQAISRAIYVPDDFVELPFVPTAPGIGDAGTALAPFVAFGFRTNRVRQDVGRGYKRFAGVGEAQQENGGSLTSGTLSAMNSIATRLGAVISFTESSLTMSYTPCIIKKEKYTTPSGKQAYRYVRPIDGGEAAQLEDTVTGLTWSPYTTVRSQVSRQFGHGS